MKSRENESLVNLPIYQQAISLFKLGRGLGVVLTDNKNIQQMHYSNHAQEQQTSLLIMNSLLLPQSIATILSTKNKTVRNLEINQLQQIISSLKMRTEQLCVSSSNAEDYLQVFRRELNKLTSLYSTWSETL